MEGDEPVGGPGAGEDGGGRTARRGPALIAISLALIASLVVAVVVSTGEDGDQAGEGLQQADGSVIAIEPGRVVLELTQPVGDRTRLELAIRPGEEELDIEHLEYHGAIGDPVRIYYEREAGGFVARRSAELPGFR